tara:strand:+ start:1282 stop:1644 length:363 start_codon:yes stop_codon:yes gene_type:complete
MFESELKKLLKAKQYKQAYGKIIEEATKERGGDTISVDALIRGRDLIDQIFQFCGDDEKRCYESVLSLFVVDFPSGLSDSGAPKTGAATKKAAQSALKSSQIPLLIGASLGVLLLLRLAR